MHKSDRVFLPKGGWFGRLVLLALCPLVFRPQILAATPCTDCIDSIQVVCVQRCQLMSGRERDACEKTCATKACAGYCSGIGAFDNSDELASEEEKNKARCYDCFGGQDDSCSRRCAGLRGDRAASCLKKCLVKKCGVGCVTAFPEFHKDVPRAKSEKCMRCEERKTRSCERMCGRQTGMEAIACVPACLKERCQTSCKENAPGGGTNPTTGERTF